MEELNSVQLEFSVIPVQFSLNTTRTLNGKLSVLALRINLEFPSGRDQRQGFSFRSLLVSQFVCFGFCDCNTSKPLAYLGKKDDSICDFHVSHNAISIPTKFCTSFVFSCTRDDCQSQEKSETLAVQNFFGENKLPYGERESPEPGEICPTQKASYHRNVHLSHQSVCSM